MKFSNSQFIQILLILLLGTVSFAFAADTVFVSQDFINAIDAAVQQMITDQTFTSKYKQLMTFPVPPCVDRPDVAYPKKNPFALRTSLTMCYEEGTEFPFTDVFQMVGKTIVDKINKQYGITLETKFKELNISQYGFFETMRRAVDSGECHVITSNTAQTAARQSVVHFQCNYGATAQAYLRSGLDTQITVDDFNDLNSTNIKVGSLAGTVYEQVIEKQLIRASYVAYPENDKLYQGILGKEVHAVIGDGVEFNAWLQQHNSTCTNCSVKVYSTPYTFGTFTSRNIAAVSEAAQLNNWMLKLISLLVVLVFCTI